ncbi:MAG: ATP-binding protein [Bacteroidales bacterium]|nr:ATP-binding protein [Bacteroidales bacterium]
MMLKRKIEKRLLEWKERADRKPLIVKGARQIGKTESIRHFASQNYAHLVEINFALQKQFRTIFDNGYEVDSILRNITFHDPSLQFVPGKTLIFFDELQDQPDCATSLKAFKMDARYDVICSGSMMGINYQKIESNSVGYKEDIEMQSMDFEEFLWAKGYSEAQIDDLYKHMVNLTPLSQSMHDALLSAFREYMVIGGMPEVVNRFIVQGHHSGILDNQRQLLLDYEEDITKYASGFDKAKVLAVYRHISSFLAKENKKFQVTKITAGARNREYVGAVEWLSNAGIVNVCYCLSNTELPLKGNYDPKNYKIYYKDTGLLIASLDEEAQDDLRVNQNLGTYKGALYENVVAEMLSKQGYSLYFYKHDNPSIEMDFFVRDANSLIPVEVKAGNSASASLTKLTNTNSAAYPDIRYGIKFCMGNIGFNGRFYTFPYFTAFLLKRFLKEQLRDANHM